MYFLRTLRCLINVRVLINIRGGKFWKTNKHTGPNKSTGWINVLNILLMWCILCKKRAILFVWDIIASNLINVRSLIRRYWWEKPLKLINVRRTFIGHPRVIRMSLILKWIILQPSNLVAKQKKHSLKSY